MKNWSESQEGTPILTATQVFLSILAGGVVGFVLGLLGGGGSILAVPLLLYVVGLHDPHVVIGSTALAVSINAYVNLIAHARAKHVWWKPAIGFSIPGIAGSYLGSVLRVYALLTLLTIVPERTAGEVLHVRVRTL